MLPWSFVKTPTGHEKYGCHDSPCTCDHLGSPSPSYLVIKPQEIPFLVKGNVVSDVSSSVCSGIGRDRIRGRVNPGLDWGLVDGWWSANRGREKEATSVAVFGMSVLGLLHA